MNSDERTGSPLRESSLSGESRHVLVGAIGLLDSTRKALTDPEHWCRGAYAKDADGDPVEGPIIEAVESSESASRCVFGELLHQGLARGYRIEIATLPELEQAAYEVTRAPATWMLAATALATALIAVNEEAERAAAERRAKHGLSSPTSRGRFILRSIGSNDYYSTHKDATAGVALAAALLRVELGSHDRSKARH